ncbi:oxidoreductase [[Mycobacterium] kokjensenii]|uniref:Oxidoreductase n=1 Tax=[Mycobacterium] kokjensenii TaxID=3064287 RepID=A0ABN9NHX6_9MYCO|nr:oxidoreductase [Mycolicibacter sp. MU0083]CAJ1504924.1 oxidoreductase [Mycolicibacter sp. MU0083]
MTNAEDPLAPLVALPGVAEASEQVRDELARVHRHKSNMRGWPVSAAEASLRAARASSVLDGGPSAVDADTTTDPVFAGALRVAQALEGGETSLVDVWRRAPLQALARLHVLAAADLVDEDALGRPQGGAEVGRRLEMLADLATGGTAVAAPVFAAVVHGELLTLAPFGSADGVVARGAARLVTIASGLDRHGLGVPEVTWMRNAADYRRAATKFATGSTPGVTAWLQLCCSAMRTGALDALGIAEAAR